MNSAAKSLGDLFSNSANSAGEGRLPLGDTVTILRELADALAYAHAQNVVHRDIKPDNVLLAGRHAFLADFGIARALEAGASFDQTMTQAPTILGTPTYMSPEQAAGSHLDHRADIYAFGVLAYEMLRCATLYRRYGRRRDGGAHGRAPRSTGRSTS